MTVSFGRTWSVSSSMIFISYFYFLLIIDQPLDYSIRILWPATQWHSYTTKQPGNTAAHSSVPNWNVTPDSSQDWKDCSLPCSLAWWDAGICHTRCTHFQGIFWYRQSEITLDLAELYTASHPSLVTIILGSEITPGQSFSFRYHILGVSNPRQFPKPPLFLTMWRQVNCLYLFS